MRISDWSSDVCSSDLFNLPLTNATCPMPSTPHARAALLMIGSTTFFGAMAVTIRLASDSLSTYQIAFFRNFFGLIALLPFLWRSGPAVLRTQQLPRYLVRRDRKSTRLNSSH